MQKAGTKASADGSAERTAGHARGIGGFGISARVTDAETDLTESAVSLFVDGRSVGRRAFVYDSGANRLFYKPRLRLEPGEHTVRVVAADERGLTVTERWRFKTR